MNSNIDILLLSSVNRNSTHAEYYTYWLKFELEKESGTILEYKPSSSTEDYKYLEIDENQKVIFKDEKWHLLKDGLEMQITKPKFQDSVITYQIIN